MMYFLKVIPGSRSLKIYREVIEQFKVYDNMLIKDDEDFEKWKQEPRDIVKECNIRYAKRRDLKTNDFEVPFCNGEYRFCAQDVGNNVVQVIATPVKSVYI